MSLTIHPGPAQKLDHEDLELWRAVPVSIVGDELNRGQMMQAAIKPLANGASFAGQAVTVRCMVGDNLALHHALQASFPGSVIVADARGHEDTAVWGAIMHLAARKKGVAAVVIDGAVRDAAEIRASGLPAYCRAVVPAGPHKGFGGEVNGVIHCGGVAVRPGDLVIGDDDGVIVVGLDRLPGLHERCLARMRKEEEVIAGIEAGKSTVELLGLPGADTEPAG